MPLIWPRGWRVIELHGALFLVNYFSFTDRRIGFDREWERDQITYFLRNVTERRSEIFFDIGAYGGLYAILVANLNVYDRLVAFEPDPKCRERLSINLHLNDLTDRVEIRPEAVSNHSGTLPFLRETAFGSGKSRVVANSDFAVPCMKLDDAFQGLREKRIPMKIDVERHEIEALDGMRSLLEANKCFLQIECFDDQISIAKSELTNLGYELIHEIGPDRYFSN